MWIRSLKYYYFSLLLNHHRYSDCFDSDLSTPTTMSWIPLFFIVLLVGKYYSLENVVSLAEKQTDSA